MNGAQKTAIVTGASQGIGAGIIQVFLELRAAFRSLR
jgi:NAD(P)-dependent dehydrogenase (short-subunit alcohol dehydrogenase family)